MPSIWVCTRLWCGKTRWSASSAAVRSVAKPGFREEDLRLLVVVAQYSAMAVATHRLQSLLKKEWTAKANLMRQFSPKVAERLLTLRGRLRLGGERSEVTILNADIRGFTNLAHEMDPDEVVHLLNEYFAAVVPVIFARNGTIDKYMGDAILAVFGSPESDPEQHENAVLAAGEMQAAVAKLNLDRQDAANPAANSGLECTAGKWCTALWELRTVWNLP